MGYPDLKTIYPKMVPHVKKAWLAALRSGDYAQAKNRLRKAGDKFCCLGVLCDLGDKSDVTWVTESGSYRYGIDTCLLPISILTATGLSPVAQTKLAAMNDDGCTFNEIADWIEENL